MVDVEEEAKRNPKSSSEARVDREHNAYTLKQGAWWAGHAMAERLCEKAAGRANPIQPGALLGSDIAAKVGLSRQSAKRATVLRALSIACPS